MFGKTSVFKGLLKHVVVGLTYGAILVMLTQPGVVAGIAWLVIFSKLQEESVRERKGQ